MTERPTDNCEAAVALETLIDIFNRDDRLSSGERDLAIGALNRAIDLLLAADMPAVR